MQWTTFITTLLLNNVVGGALSAGVGLIVTFLLKRWFNQLKAEQERTTAAATAAASRAGVSADLSRVAVEHASSASENAKTASVDAKAAAEHADAANRSAGEAKETALEIKESNGRVVTVIPERDDAVEYLRETNSRLVAQLVIQASRHPEDFDSPTAPRFGPPVVDTEAAYITGRHLLRAPSVDGV